jgi:hypothetical protein
VWRAFANRSLSSRLSGSLLENQFSVGRSALSVGRCPSTCPKKPS